MNTRESYNMDEVFESLRLPLRTLNDVRPNGTALFMLLIGRGYTDVQGHLRWFISTRYSEVLNLFTFYHESKPRADGRVVVLAITFHVGNVRIYDGL